MSESIEKQGNRQNGLKGYRFIWVSDCVSSIKNYKIRWWQALLFFILYYNYRRAELSHLSRISRNAAALYIPIFALDED